jgi:hypothetical protein
VTLGKLLFLLVAGIGLIIFELWLGNDTFSPAPVFRGRLIVTGSNTFEITQPSLFETIAIPSCRETAATDEEIDDGLGGHRFNDLRGEIVDASWSTRGQFGATGEFRQEMVDECVHLRIRPMSMHGMEGVSRVGVEFGWTYLIGRFVLLALALVVGTGFLCHALENVGKVWRLREAWNLEKRRKKDREIALQEKQRAAEVKMLRQVQCADRIFAALSDACSKADLPDLLICRKRQERDGEILQNHVEVFPARHVGWDDPEIVVWIRVDLELVDREIAITTYRDDLLMEQHQDGLPSGPFLELGFVRGEDFVKSKLASRIQTFGKKITA